jgi:LmbE family N-acetylglucosaminyl deacetylase
MSSLKSGRRVHWLFRFIVADAYLLTAFVGFCQVAVPPLSSVILQDLRSFREMGSVLYVAAHPDDENNQLIAYLARGRDYRTAYLSLTRGDGGQNVLGSEFGEELGVIRTEELLAARRVDGGRQYFSRAFDFGYSKDYLETLRIWDRQEVLGDTVRVIREFRPDVIITRFSPVPGGTHGHHTASTVLAIEAFKLAGDPKSFPEQLREGLTPWQPKRILWNMGGFQRGGGETNVVRIDDGGKDPVTGEPFTDIAGRSRSMHKTQGFGNYTGGGGSGPRSESFALLAGEPATNDILDGVDDTWNRVPGGAEIGKLADAVIAGFNSQDPAARVPALLQIKKLLAPLATGDPVVNEKRQNLDHIIQECLGLTVETEIPNAEVVPGEPLKMHLAATVRSDIVPVRWVEARFPSIKTKLSIGTDLTALQSVSHDAVETLPADTLVSQPYWLREEHTAGMFVVDDPNLIGRPENPPVFPVEQVFGVGRQMLIVPEQPVQITAERTEGEPRNLTVISPVSLKLGSEVALFAPGATRPVAVEVTAARPDTAGTLRLNAPAGWKVAPATQAFRLGKAGEQTKLAFTVTAPAQPTTAGITAEVKVGGRLYDNERVVINYPHIPLVLLQPSARLKAVCLNLAVRGQNIGYLPGAGDSVAECLEDMGYKVTTLSGTDLTPDQLQKFDAVVIGVRAFNVRTDLVSQLPALFSYVENGGTIIAQYNRPDGLKTSKLAPYDLHLSGDRVTDETATMTFLAPDNPVLNTPNKITAADFDGWVQERGIYFPNQWDDHFTPIFACHDPGESPLKGSLLVAQYGKGYYVYTGLDFFRELPAGVPGAYRLFANLISLGK